MCISLFVLRNDSTVQVQTDMKHVMLDMFCTFTLAFPEECVGRPIWLFLVRPSYYYYYYCCCFVVVVTSCCADKLLYSVRVTLPVNDS
jgi:hypothetical protein